jgi:hypothetical protein
MCFFITIPLVYNFHQQLIIRYNDIKAFTNNLKNSRPRHICKYEVQTLHALPVMIHGRTKEVLWLGGTSVRASGSRKILDGLQRENRFWDAEI